MDVSLLIVKIVRSARKVGFRATIRRAFGFQGLGGLLRHGSKTDAFDFKYGTDTAEPAPLWKFRIDSPNARFGAGYQTVSEDALIDSLRLLPEDLRLLTFIDLGCGKGRALLVAASLGFKQVIGVEFVHELAKIARKNLAKVGAENAVVVETDAAKYRFPNSDMVIYFFNPFSQEVMEKVIANLKESLPRKLYVIYAAPQCAALLDDSGFLSREDFPQPRPDIQIWRLVDTTTYPRESRSFRRAT
jgi:SAM-dependent methyltransferase